MKRSTQLKNLYEKARQKRWVRWSMDLALVFVVILGVGAYQTRSHLKDAPLPSVTLVTLEGEPFALDSLKGRPTLLWFWAPWCGVCKTASPNVSWVMDLVGDRANVVSLAVSYENREEVRAYVAEQGVDYPVLLGGDRLAAELEVAAFPTVYFLDAEGRVKGSAVGYTTTVGLLARLLF